MNEKRMEGSVAAATLRTATVLYCDGVLLLYRWGALNEEGATFNGTATTTTTPQSGEQSLSPLSPLSPLSCIQ